MTQAVVATAETDSDGRYTIADLSAGLAYNLTADCGSSKFVAIAKADTKSAAEKEDSPVFISPVSTLIAVKIISAILTAIESATAGLSPEMTKAIKQTFLEKADSMIAAIQDSVETSVRSGSWRAPSASEATQITENLSSAQTASQVASTVNEFESQNPAPASVRQAIEGAKNQGAIFSDCDSRIQGKSVSTCTKAVAKLLFSSLGLNVMVRTEGGVFGTVECSSSGLGQDFRNADFEDSEGLVPAGYCLILPRIQVVDRNGHRSGSNAGPAFAETGNMDGQVGDETGFLSALGSTLFSRQNYRLQDLQNMIFTRSSGVGLNARLFNIRTSYVIEEDPMSGGSQSNYYYRKNNVWTLAPLRNLEYRDANNSHCDDADCLVWNIYDLPIDANWNLKSGVTDVSAEGELSSILSAINSSSADGVIKDRFAGPLPTMSQLDQFLDERYHEDYNPSGRREIYGIYKERVKSDAVGCWDHNPQTPCLGVSETEYPILRVDLELGDPTSEDIRPIQRLTANNAGKYIFNPSYDSDGRFRGVMSLWDIGTGDSVRD